jgi:hypothetical protein
MSDATSETWCHGALLALLLKLESIRSDGSSTRIDVRRCEWDIPPTGNLQLIRFIVTYRLSSSSHGVSLSTFEVE